MAFHGLQQRYLYLNNVMENKCMQIVHVVNSPSFFRAIISMLAELTKRIDRLTSFWKIYWLSW
jgi:5'(3')-deoxyribonucleotidase